ncbi:MAG: formate--tetrahydrofolate ligase [Betaproteobacteria bacterium TMED82]|nr:MAG: formate--tetrahydrofolate ligase [Betaproteobacteria bacterium TMED82]|tara:strand:+ start:10998 stop:12668 length:1671 start_codon:yes stop_codon:yes gene_type:complete
MPSDIEIAQNANIEKIVKIASKIGISETSLIPYGHSKAKVTLDFLSSLKSKQDGKLILVTAISPTPAGEGKTTTTVGLGDGLNRIGKNTVICLREPSLGPVFGVKGGAAGGGYAQIVPMEDINLHFTGDFSAIALANNLLSAMIDNHIHQGNALNIDSRRVTWKRVVDMNDRALRDVAVGLGGPGNGYTRQDGFDIVVASEVMAIFCLAESVEDLKSRLGQIVIGTTREGKLIHARELNAHGAMTVLLKDALQPNLVQTLENNPAFVHGGPFANIAHGCNSVIATKSALKLGDYVVTEAGFGADLGAEKFIDIKCRKTDLKPCVAVIVATVRALKYHGGIEVKNLNSENCDALEKGLVNLERHVHNVKSNYGLPCVVSINKFNFDTIKEVEIIKKRMTTLGVSVVLAEHWAKGGEGAEDLAKEVVRLSELNSQPTYVYPDEDTLLEKVRKVAMNIYGASDITASSKVKAQLETWEKSGFGKYPVCIAKTQSSFSTDASIRGAPSGHIVNIREVRLAAGAEFIVAVCGEIMTMPGLPRFPSAEKIDVDSGGKVIGLF